MRFGLAGTGPWARLAHGPGLLACPDAELVGVWGRTPDRAAELAAQLGVPAYDDYDALVADVEAMAFALPPDVQATLATLAAREGRHVLLDKPVAVDVTLARELADAVRQAGVASVVFLTDRFAPATREWLASVARTGGWTGAQVRWLSCLDTPDNPFGQSPWRHQHGALWDLGPHVLSTLIAALGPVRDVVATPGRQDHVSLAVQHEDGATSTVVLSAHAPPAAGGHEAVLWGEAGLSPMPSREDEAVPGLFAVAASELVDAARDGNGHALDAEFGLHLVEVLATAQAQLDRAST